MSIYLEKYPPNRNLARYYYLAVLPNLFGEWTLERRWGRVGQKGQTRLECITKKEAKAVFDYLELTKRRRGYG